MCKSVRACSVRVGIAHERTHRTAVCKPPSFCAHLLWLLAQAGVLIPNQYTGSMQALLCRVCNINSAKPLPTLHAWTPSFLWTNHTRAQVLFLPRPFHMQVRIPPPHTRSHARTCTCSRSRGCSSSCCSSRFLRCGLLLGRVRSAAHVCMCVCGCVCRCVSMCVRARTQVKWQCFAMPTGHAVCSACSVCVCACM